MRVGISELSPTFVLRKVTAICIKRYCCSANVIVSPNKSRGYLGFRDFLLDAIT